MTAQNEKIPAETDKSSGWYSNDNATFGDRLAGARDAIGLSQSDLANKLGVKLRTVEGWENDIIDPRANKLQMLAGLLNVSLMWLLNGEGDGLSDPADAIEGSVDFSTILAEMRALKGTITQAGDTLAKLEKRLRIALRDAAA